MACSGSIARRGGDLGRVGRFICWRGFIPSMGFSVNAFLCVPIVPIGAGSASLQGVASREGKRQTRSGAPLAQWRPAYPPILELRFLGSSAACFYSRDRQLYLSCSHRLAASRLAATF